MIEIKLFRIFVDISSILLTRKNGFLDCINIHNSFLCFNVQRENTINRDVFYCRLKYLKHEFANFKKCFKHKDFSHHNLHESFSCNIQWFVCLIKNPNLHSHLLNEMEIAKLYASGWTKWTRPTRFKKLIELVT